jgi:hypothetical protein
LMYAGSSGSLSFGLATGPVLSLTVGYGPYLIVNDDNKQRSVSYLER